MTEKLKSLGELELEVLKAIWERPGSTVQEIAEVMVARRDCARTTVLTVMQRLHGKGFLKRRKLDGVYRFTPTKERDNVMLKLVGQFVDTVLDGSPAPFLAYLADAKDLTDEQAAQLRAIVRQLERQEEGS